jgi:hypothetical protein
MTQHLTSFPARPAAAVVVAAAAMLTLAASSARAQQPATATAAAAPAAAVPGPAIGDMAPDFTLVGATRYGLLRDSVRLSSFRGQTVVLAFFYKARTKG